MKNYETILKGEKYTVLCNYKNTRNGFIHEAEILKNGWIISFGRCRYINRAYERYEYESAIHKAIDNAKLSTDKAENEKLRTALKRQFDKKALPAWSWSV